MTLTEISQSLGSFAQKSFFRATGITRINRRPISLEEMQLLSPMQFAKYFDLWKLADSLNKWRKQPEAMKVKEFQTIRNSPLSLENWIQSIRTKPQSVGAKVRYAGSFATFVLINLVNSLIKGIAAALWIAGNLILAVCSATLSVVAKTALGVSNLGAKVTSALAGKGSTFATNRAGPKNTNGKEVYNVSMLTPGELAFMPLEQRARDEMGVEYTEGRGEAIMDGLKISNPQALRWAIQNQKEACVQFFIDMINKGVRSILFTGFAETVGSAIAALEKIQSMPRGCDGEDEDREKANHILDYLIAANFPISDKDQEFIHMRPSRESSITPDY